MGRREIYFIKAEAILYLLFLWLDMGHISPFISNLLKFSGIVLCFFYVLTKKVMVGKKDKKIMILAFIFTLLADFCMVLFSCNLGGLIFFPVVQFLYWYRLEPITLKGIGVRLLGFGCLMGIIFLAKGSIDIILFLASFYIIQITFNVVLALKHWYKKRNKIAKGGFFAIGMVLFFLCDLHVGLAGAAEYIQNKSGMLGTFYGFIQIAVWAYYLPSQVLIALSCED